MLTDARRLRRRAAGGPPLDDLLERPTSTSRAGKGRPIAAAGSVARRWQAYADEGGDHAYAAGLGNDEVLVYGSPDRGPAPGGRLLADR